MRSDSDGGGGGGGNGSGIWQKVCFALLLNTNMIKRTMSQSESDSDSESMWYLYRAITIIIIIAAHTMCNVQLNERVYSVTLKWIVHIDIYIFWWCIAQHRGCRIKPNTYQISTLIQIIAFLFQTLSQLNSALIL